MLEKLTGWARDGGLLLAILALLIGILSIVLGGQSVLGMLGGGAPNTPGIWALICMAFLSGSMYQTYADINNSHGTTHVVETKEGRLRTGIALAIFSISLIFGTDFLASLSMTRFEFLQALPNSLLAVGAYVVIVQAPWSAYEMSEVHTRTHPKNRFTHYYLETRLNDADPWIRPNCEPQTHQQAMTQMRETHKIKSNIQARVVKVSGASEVYAISDSIPEQTPNLGVAKT
jgi:hypothetical protein